MVATPQSIRYDIVAAGISETYQACMMLSSAIYTDMNGVKDGSVCDAVIVI